MNNKISEAMSDFIKRLRLERILIVVLAGVLLLVTTACNPSSSNVSSKPNSPSVSGPGDYHERAGQPIGIREYTDRADKKSRPDMDSYSDNDSRDTAAVRARAKELSDRAERNVQKVQSPGEFVEEYKAGTPIQERVRNIADDIGESAEQFKEDFAAGARENTRNLKANTDKAGRNIQRTADDTQRNARRAAEDATDAVRDRA